ncbi:unnamed protein product [Brassica rapa subsp. narinosa]
MIKMNPLFVNLPYMDAFTLGVIKDQRLVFFTYYFFPSYSFRHLFSFVNHPCTKLIKYYSAQASGLIKGIFPQPFVATIDPFKLDNSCCLVI